MTAKGDPAASGTQQIDCDADSTAALEQMFVHIIQQGRIDSGQMPALRPVFLKPHGVAKGRLTVRADAPAHLRCGIFTGDSWPILARFSADTTPGNHDFEKTLGIGLKLFDVPGPKIFGNPNDTTFDLIMQNHNVFFLDTARDMCAFTYAIVIDRDVGAYLDKHPKFDAILNAMKKPEPSVLSAPYWSLLPMAFGDTHAKLALQPDLALPPLEAAPDNPDFLAADLATRLAAAPARFTLSVQLRTDPDTMPLDAATQPWDTAKSPFIPLADLVFDTQDIHANDQPAKGENASYNIWRVTADHTPAGSIAEARRKVYGASASLRRRTNKIPQTEPKEP